MKMTHRVPDVALTSNMENRVDSDYLADVDQQTARREREHAQALRRVEAAERRAARAADRVARAAKASERRSAERARLVALEQVELRRMELRALELIMSAAPASAAHRGVKSFRPVPIVGGAR